MAKAPYSISPILSLATSLLIQLWSHCVRGILPEISFCIFRPHGSCIYSINVSSKFPIKMTKHLVGGIILLDCTIIWFQMVLRCCWAENSERYSPILSQPFKFMQIKYQKCTLILLRFGIIVRSWECVILVMDSLTECFYTMGKGVAPTWHGLILLHAATWTNFSTKFLWAD